MFVINGAPA